MKLRPSIAAALLIATSTPLAAHAQYDAAKTRPAMQQLYLDLRQLLPIAVSEGAFAEPANQPRVRDALRALARDAGALDDHTRGFDPGARYIARSLSRDVRNALRHFDEGNYPAAEFYVLETSSTCVACHSRLPSQKDSEVARGFLDTAELSRRCRSWSAPGCRPRPASSTPRWSRSSRPSPQATSIRSSCSVR